ncbi:MAG: kynureninase, partial [Chloroflexota bacterium]
DGRTISETDIIAAMSDTVALVVLPSVLYQSGQLLDLATLSRAARDRGIPIGFDCAHSVGCIPHHFDAWDADFAFWCTYKYLNAGPGSIGALYVNRRHFGITPGLAGWWGYHKERQFDMLLQWQSAGNAGAWQISTPPILSAASLLGSLQLFAEAGIERIREKSLALTSYLIALLDASGLTAPPYSFTVVTPREPARRGGHVAIAHAAAPRIVRALKRRGVVPDFRPPDMIRLAPVALYTSFHDVWLVVQHLRDIIDTGEDKQGPETRELVA